MSDQRDKNSMVKRIFAWSGLFLIAVLIIVIIYALITKNGNMAVAAIFSLILLSGVYWLGILVYKRLTRMKDFEDQVKEKEKINVMSKINTKNI